MGFMCLIKLVKLSDKRIQRTLKMATGLKKWLHITKNYFKIKAHWGY